jgi:general secretion pathway protein I
VEQRDAAGAVSPRSGSTGGSGSTGECGLTLLEVLVAFLIAAAAITAVVRTTTIATALTREAGRYDEAIARGRSHLATMSAMPLIDSDRQGEEGGGYHWHVRVAAEGSVHTGSKLATVPAGLVTLYRISVTISWSDNGRSRAVQLDSARLGPLTS